MPYEFEKSAEEYNIFPGDDKCFFHNLKPPDELQFRGSGKIAGSGEHFV